MYQKADPASIKKIRRKCATVAPISPLRPPGEPSPTRQRGKNPKNMAQTRHSCTLFHIYQEPTQEKAKNTAQTRHSCTISFRGKPTRQSPAVGIARSILLYSCIQQNQPVPFV